MEPTAKSSQKPAINDTSLLACLPEPVLELVLAAAGPRARMRSARCSRGPGRRAAARQVLARGLHAALVARPRGAGARKVRGRVRGAHQGRAGLLRPPRSAGRVRQPAHVAAEERLRRAGGRRRLRASRQNRSGDERLLGAAHADGGALGAAHAGGGRTPAPAAVPQHDGGLGRRRLAAAARRSARAARRVLLETTRDLLTHAQTARLRNRWRPAPSLEEAAARVASAFRVFYDGEGVVRALEALAARVRAASASDDQLALIRATEAVLFDECGFRGVDADEYYAASNSFLDEVLRRRAGIPISLACLFWLLRKGLASQGAPRP